MTIPLKEIEIIQTKIIGKEEDKIEVEKNIVGITPEIIEEIPIKNSKRGVRALAPVSGSLPRRHDAQALEANSRKRKLSVGEMLLRLDERSFTCRNR